MGLFGKKRPDDDDDDSVETRASDLMASSRGKPPPPPPAHESSDLPTKAHSSMKPSEAKTIASPVMPGGRPPTLAPSMPLVPFGIEEAVLLVRQLPTRN